MTRGLELAWANIKVLLSLPMKCAVVIITSVAKLHNHQIQNLPPCAYYGLTVVPVDTLVIYITVTRPPLPLSPTELVPPNTLHTDRPYILYSSTWVQAAPACSGFVSPYAVIVRYANWRPRGWPCPAGVGGDPPFPSMYTSPARRRPLCSLGRSEHYRPHNRRASLRPPRPLTLPSIPSHM